MDSLDSKNINLLLNILSGKPLHDRKTHMQLCAALLGDGYEAVHKVKDAPSKYLGKGHRVVLHDRATNIAIGLLSGDPKAFVAAELHDLLDFSDTKLRRKLRK